MLTYWLSMRWVACAVVFASLCTAQSHGLSDGTWRAFATKQVRAAALESRANQTVKALSNLAQQGQVASSDDAIQQMKRMVDELASIRAELKAISAEQKKIQKATANLERFQPNGFIQYQYKDSDESGRQESGFAHRRVRLGANYIVDAKTFFRVSIEFASGANNLQAQLWDAFGQYTEGLLTAIAGQYVFPLGYDIPRSSAEGEFPERALYNRRLFPGENGRGIGIRYGRPAGWSMQLGLWDALSANDPEQNALRPAEKGRLAGTATLRYANPSIQFGAALYVGSRPESETSAAILPSSKRHFTYLDVAWSPKSAKGFTLRGEAMWGRERLAGAADARAVSGWQATAIYRARPDLEFALRHENSDFDLRKNAIGAVDGWSGVVSYWLNPKTKLSLAYEAFVDPSRNPKRYSIVTARMQIRF